MPDNSPDPASVPPAQDDSATELANTNSMADTPLASTVEKPARIIGRYRLVRELGKGGFGIVWQAEQTEPIRREVALKIIKPGMDSAEIIARFEAERQTLALMDHPNIAAVLDAGTTERDRPYFVMELVKGEPITDYCDAHKLTIRQRLELFIPVCHAVQHAHQKAILHRDLKPSNILVTEVDGKPVPKVIDFGIAKAVGGTASEALRATLALTQQGAVIGTPQYMSPEQAGSMPDTDTRSDIYTLGVILYELVTGCTPLSRETLQQAALDEVLRLIREAEPLRPSSRIVPVTDAVRQTSAARAVEPAKLKRALRGDLDWIILKALEKERERRYRSAAALAEDLERHQHDEPVEAAPPSAIYRLGKLMRRYRVAVSISAALLVMCLFYQYFAVYTSRGSVTRRNRAIGEIMARAANDVLVLEDKHAAEQILLALSADPEIVAACIYNDTSGRIIATYPAEAAEEKFIPMAAAPAGWLENNGQMVRVVPIFQDGSHPRRRIATLELIATLEDVGSAGSDAVKVIAMFAIISLLVGAAISTIIKLSSRSPNSASPMRRIGK